MTSGAEDLFQLTCPTASGPSQKDHPPDDFAALGGWAINCHSFHHVPSDCCESADVLLTFLRKCLAFGKYHFWDVGPGPRVKVLRPHEVQSVVLRHDWLWVIMSALAKAFRNKDSGLYRGPNKSWGQTSNLLKLNCWRQTTNKYFDHPWSMEPYSYEWLIHEYLPNIQMTKFAVSKLYLELSPWVAATFSLGCSTNLSKQRIPIRLGSWSSICCSIRIWNLGSLI